MRRGWEAEARNWAEFTRAAGRDVAHEQINLPALLRLLPGPAGLTPFTIAGSYLDPGPADTVIDRGGVQLIFHSEHRPLESYSRALEAAGLLIEAIREPKAPDGRWQRIPLSLQLRAVKP
jgi:hypothetical protein